MLAIFGCVMCFGLVSVSDEKGTFTSLLLPSGTEITRIYDSPYAEGNAGWDAAYKNDVQSPGSDPREAALHAALDSIRLEHIPQAGSYRPDETQLTFLLSDGKFTYLSDRIIPAATETQATAIWLRITWIGTRSAPVSGRLSKLCYPTLLPC